LGEPSSALGSGEAPIAAAAGGAEVRRRGGRCAGCPSQGGDERRDCDVGAVEGDVDVRAAAAAMLRRAGGDPRDARPAESVAESAFEGGDPRGFGRPAQRVTVAALAHGEGVPRHGQEQVERRACLASRGGGGAPALRPAATVGAVAPAFPCQSEGVASGGGARGGAGSAYYRSRARA